MNVFAKFDKIPSMILEVIKETKRYGHTFGRTVVRSDNVKTVYPPTNTVCGGYTLPQTQFAGGIIIINYASKRYIRILQGAEWSGSAVCSSLSI